MTTVIILGILGGIGALIALIAFVFAVINLFRQNKLSWVKIGAGFIGGGVLGAIAAIGITSTLVQNADKIVNAGERVLESNVGKITNVGERALESSIDKAQGVVTKVTEAGATAVSEGVEGTVDHFVDKKVKEMITASKSITLEYIGSKSLGNSTVVDVGIKNNGEKLSLQDLVASGVLVAVDTEGYEHTFTSDQIDSPELLPGSNRRHMLNVKHPSNITISGVRFSGHDSDTN